MPDRYLLPCPSCENAINLTLKQAGQELTCEGCNEPVQAPSMGGIRMLDLAEGGAIAAKANPGSSFSPLQRWLFAGGLTLAVLAGSASLGLYRYASSIHREVEIESVIEFEKEMVDKLRAAEVFAASVAASQNELALEYREPTYRGSNKQSEILSTVSYGLAGLAGVGVLSLLASLVMGFGKKP